MSLSHHLWTSVIFLIKTYFLFIFNEFKKAFLSIVYCACFFFFRGRVRVGVFYLLRIFNKFFFFFFDFTMLLVVTGLLSFLNLNLTLDFWLIIHACEDTQEKIYMLYWSLQFFLRSSQLKLYSAVSNLSIFFSLWKDL